MSGECARTCSCFQAEGTARRYAVFIKNVYGNKFIGQLVPAGQSTVNVLKKKQSSKMFSPSLLSLSSISTCDFPALEKEMATHSSILAWRIPGTEEPGGMSSMGSHRVRHD